MNHSPYLNKSGGELTSWRNVRTAYEMMKGCRMTAAYREEVWEEKIFPSDSDWKHRAEELYVLSKAIGTSTSHRKDVICFIISVKNRMNWWFVSRVHCSSKVSVERRGGRHRVTVTHLLTIKRSGCRTKVLDWVKIDYPLTRTESLE